MTAQQLAALVQEGCEIGNTPLLRLDNLRLAIQYENIFLMRDEQDKVINDARRAGLVTLTGLESTRNVDNLNNLLDASIREYDQCLSYISLKVKE
jgi:hypothetical protein